MAEYKMTFHRANEKISAPEGFYFKESHYSTDDMGERLVIIWEGRPTPPSLVRLCNQLVRAAYGAAAEPTTPTIITSIERELYAHGLQEPS